ncbi:hypothetical protein PG993_008548 [Apiospora rasikravindrae]|uniref:Uncharacterized protein n=1 Tax=Apiospora rasikravindrae TaxID=990691 RepID=A0ABR1T0N1_9PEZI
MVQMSWSCHGLRGDESDHGAEDYEEDSPDHTNDRGCGPPKADMTMSNIRNAAHSSQSTHSDIVNGGDADVKADVDVGVKAR